MAFWFSSLCSLLGARRPQDVLTTDPGMVVAAAVDEIQAITHG